MRDKIKIINLPSFTDKRGVLTSIEGNQDIPFEIKRIFYMHNIKSERGGHAHKDTDQILIAISGSMLVTLSDGKAKVSYKMDDPTKGLYIPRLTFTEMTDFVENTVCLVIANTHYDNGKSIRSWDEYLRFINLT